MWVHLSHQLKVVKTPPFFFAREMHSFDVFFFESISVKTEVLTRFLEEMSATVGAVAAGAFSLGRLVLLMLWKTFEEISAVQCRVLFYFPNNLLIQRFLILIVCVWTQSSCFFSLFYSICDSNPCVLSNVMKQINYDLLWGFFSVAGRLCSCVDMSSVHLRF